MKTCTDLYHSGNVTLDLTQHEDRNLLAILPMQELSHKLEKLIKEYFPNEGKEVFVNITTHPIVDGGVRDGWFQDLPIRFLISTKEFFHVWYDYKCTSPQSFSDVCEDIWFNGWDEDDRNKFYLKYRDLEFI
jgi:hypothetical protein